MTQSQHPPESTRAQDNGLWFTTAQVHVRQARPRHAGGISLLEHRMAGGFSPPQHVHHDEDETFYVLEGRFRFESNGEVRHLHAGEAIFLPRGIPHGFFVESPEGGRCLTITNGGFEAMVRDTSRPAAFDGLPPQDEPTLELQTHLAERCAAHGIELIGPPLV